MFTASLDTLASGAASPEGVNTEQAYKHVGVQFPCPPP